MVSSVRSVDQTWEVKPAAFSAHTSLNVWLSSCEFGTSGHPPLAPASLHAWRCLQPCKKKCNMRGSESNCEQEIRTKSVTVTVHKDTHPANVGVTARSSIIASPSPPAPSAASFTMEPAPLVTYLLTPSTA